MAWFIDPNINDGYPWRDDFPQKFQSDWSGELPYNAWRIQDGVNEGYPWIWWFPNFRDQSSSSSGQMVIGGSQTNYPNGFTYANRGSVAGAFDTKSMKVSGNGGRVFVAGAINDSLAGKHFILDGTDLQRVRTYIGGDTFIDSLDNNLIANVFGGNIYDGFLVCKAYPFALTSALAPTDARMYGRFLISPFTITPAQVVVVNLQLGSFDIPITQAWEVEAIDYSIYLPFAGTFPLDIRCGCNVSAELYVDLYHGIGEYYVYQDDQESGSYRCQIGADIPLNFNQGIMNSNLLSNVMSTVSPGIQAGLSMAGGAIGGAIGGPIGSAIGSSLGNNAGSLITNATTTHMTPQTPQVGGLSSSYCYPYARILAKIPKMFKNGYGFDETLGENRNVCYAQLSDCSGFVQTKNYKCDVIVATNEEKAEIERLMDSGVFL